MRRFQLRRGEDVSGVSGTGLVAFGVEFPDSQCVLWWPNEGTVGIYHNREAVMRIHGHQGRTTIEFLD